MLCNKSDYMMRFRGRQRVKTHLYQVVHNEKWNDDGEEYWSGVADDDYSSDNSEEC